MSICQMPANGCWKLTAGAAATHLVKVQIVKLLDAYCLLLTACQWIACQLWLKPKLQSQCSNTSIRSGLPGMAVSKLPKQPPTVAQSNFRDIVHPPTHTLATSYSDIHTKAKAIFSHRPAWICLNQNHFNFLRLRLRLGQPSLHEYKIYLLPFFSHSQFLGLQF